MGHLIKVKESSFFIAQKDKAAALLAIQKLHGMETIEDGGGKHFAYVRPDFYKIEDLQSMLEEWRWKPRLNASDDIVEIRFTGEQDGDEGLLFKTLAPFVQDGSFIHFMGETFHPDGEWKYEFKKGKVSCKKGMPNEGFGPKIGDEIILSKQQLGWLQDGLVCGLGKLIDAKDEPAVRELMFHLSHLYNKIPGWEKTKGLPAYKITPLKD